MENFDKEDLDFEQTFLAKIIKLFIIMIAIIINTNFLIKIVIIIKTMLLTAIIDYYPGPPMLGKFP